MSDLVTIELRGTPIAVEHECADATLPYSIYCNCESCVQLTVAMGMVGGLLRGMYEDDPEHEFTEEELADGRRFTIHEASEETKQAKILGRIEALEIQAGLRKSQLASEAPADQEQTEAAT